MLDGSWFKDRYGRTALLRGVNLSGSSKIPARPDTTTMSEAAFYNHRAVSFVGRPFLLDEADEHFARLQRWGFTFLRFLVPWEAVEHDGPGQYDEEYLDYLYQVVARAADYDIQVFIDPHQDTWSRFSGGDGAPGWTFDVAGLDITKFRATGAASIYPYDRQPFVVHWLTNYTRLASATMFTLFFGGRDFAPHLTVDGESVQDYLQRHYINAYKQVARRLQGLPNVVGFGTMNEPSSGFIGRHPHAQNEELIMRRLGISPTPFQAILTGSGYPQRVERWGVSPTGLYAYGKATLNRSGQRAWQEGRECIWRTHGVWDVDANGEPRLLRPHHFTHVVRDGVLQRVEFGRDYLRPFVNTFAHEMRQVAPSTILFVETVPRLDMPRWNAEDAPNVVNASHWYDTFSLVTGLFFPFVNLDIKVGRLVVGDNRIHQLFVDQLQALKDNSREEMGGVPTLLGEFGISFHMPLKLNVLLKWFSMQEWAMDASFRAVEATLLNATLWNYTPDNTNRLGDRWNTEDLSIFSRDQQHNPDDPDSGGRALRAAVRPYPRATAGEPLHLSFDWRKRRATYTFRHDPAVSEPTELFVPALQYPDGYVVQVSDGWYEQDTERQIVRYWHGDEQEIHAIQIFSIHDVGGVHSCAPEHATYETYDRMEVS